MQNKKINSIIKLHRSPPGFGSIIDPPVDGTTGNPVQHTHEYFSDDELGLYVGVWDTTNMCETSGPYSMDEFMLVLEGNVLIKDNQKNEYTTIKAGETFAIPKGYDCQWQQKGYLRKFFFISDHPNEVIPNAPAHNAIVCPIADRNMSNASDANPFLSEDDVKQQEFIDYLDGTGRFRVHTWQCEPFKSKLRQFPHFQLFLLEKGSIMITDEQQVRHDMVVGDVFFIPEGAICSAETKERITVISASLKK